MRHIPNAVSLVRLILLIPYVWTPVPLAALILALAIIGSDGLDGWLARRMKEASRLGAALDTAADTAFVFLSWIMFFLAGRYGPGFLVLLLLPRLATGISLLLYRCRRGVWNNDHLAGDKMGGAAQYLGILWLLSGLPAGRELLVAVLLVNFLGVYLSIRERFSASCHPEPVEGHP